MLFRLYIKFSLTKKDKKGGEREREFMSHVYIQLFLCIRIVGEETTKYMVMIMHYKYGPVQLSLHSELQTSSMISVAAL